MFSSLQRIGAVSEKAQFLQFTGFATFGSGSIDKYACPPGERPPVGTCEIFVKALPPTVGVGSHLFPVPLRSVRGLRKSPCFSAAVGTSPVRMAPRCYGSIP